MISSLADLVVRPSQAFMLAWEPCKGLCVLSLNSGASDMAKPAVYVNISLPGTYSMTYTSGAVITTTYPGCFTAQREIPLTVTTSQWRQRLAGLAVWVPPTNYRVFFDRFEVGYGLQVFKAGGWTRTGFFIAHRITTDEIGAPTTLQLAYAKEKAEKRALAALKNQNVNFANFFGEVNETASLLKSTATRLTAFAKKAKKGNVVGALRELGTLGSQRQVKRAASQIRRKVGIHRNAAQQAGETWSASKQLASTVIESRFGWQPLLDDVYGAAKLLADRTTSDPKRTRFHVKGKWKQSLKGKKSFETGSYTSYDTVTGEYGAVVRLYFFFTNAALASASADGLTNPSTLWELGPWTFAADWCTGIGDWLGALDSSLGKEFVGGTVTMYEDWSVKRNTIFKASGGYYGQVPSSQRRKFVNRGVYGNFPDATMLSLNIANPLNTTRRLTTALALLRQSFS